MRKMETREQFLKRAGRDYKDYIRYAGNYLKEAIELKKLDPEKAMWAFFGYTYTMTDTRKLGFAMEHIDHCYIHPDDYEENKNE